MLTPGRLLFGFALLGFGVVGLLYVDFLNALQPMPAWTPLYRLLAILNGLGLVAAGGAILTGRKTRPAALAIVGLFGACIVVMQVPSAFVQPELLRSPWWVRTFESVALLGGAATLAGLCDVPVRKAWVRRGRIAFGLSLPVFGVLHLIYVPSVASLIPPWYPWPDFWAVFTGVAQIAGGLAIAVGVWPRIAAVLAGAMYGLWGLTLHAPRMWCRLWGPCEFLDAPGGLAASRGPLTSLFIAFGMCGAAWLVAGGLARLRTETDTGPPAETPQGREHFIRTDTNGG